MKFIVLYQEIGDKGGPDVYNLDAYVILEASAELERHDDLRPAVAPRRIFGPDPEEMIEAMTKYGLSCYDIRDATIYVLPEEDFKLPQELVDEMMRKHDEAFRKTIKKARGQ